MLPKGYLIGNLTADPQSGVAKSNSNSYARFSVACNEIYAKQSETPKAHFFNCVAWGKRAQYIQKFLKKGDKVFLEYSLSANSYTNTEGRIVKTIDLVVDNIEFVGNRQIAAENSATSQESHLEDKDARPDLDVDSLAEDEEEDLLKQIYSDS